MTDDLPLPPPTDDPDQPLNRDELLDLLASLRLDGVDAEPELVASGHDADITEVDLSRRVAELSTVRSLLADGLDGITAGPTGDEVAAARRERAIAAALDHRGGARTGSSDATSHGSVATMPRRTRRLAPALTAAAVLLIGGIGVAALVSSGSGSDTAVDVALESSSQEADSAGTSDGTTSGHEQEDIGTTDAAAGSTAADAGAPRAPDELRANGAEQLSASELPWLGAFESVAAALDAAGSGRDELDTTITVSPAAAPGWVGELLPCLDTVTAQGLRPVAIASVRSAPYLVVVELDGTFGARSLPSCALVDPAGP